MTARAFDIVLYGATGFTGRQTVDYFRKYAPAGVRWAIAGRNREKLEALAAGVPVLVANSGNLEQLRDVTASTRVVLTTAGPFAVYGDALVQACVRTGTHYVDITGEVAWVRSLIDRFHEQAAKGGTRIVPFCGFDSVPADLGVHVLAGYLGPGLCEARGYFQARGGGPNGGTIASAQQTYESSAAEQGRDLRLLSPEITGPMQPMEQDPTRAGYDRDVQAWIAPFPMSIIDTRVVRRSCSLAGVDVAYQEFMIFEGPMARFSALGVAAGTALFYKALQTPSVRNFLARRFKAGQGPSPQTMDEGWFHCRMRGRTRAGRTAEAVIADCGDPANRVTVKCVCESALALACDEATLPRAAGILTPAAGLGDALVERLRDRGMVIEVGEVGASASARDGSALRSWHPSARKRLTADRKPK